MLLNVFLYALKLHGSIAGYFLTQIGIFLAKGQKDILYQGIQRTFYFLNR